MAMRLTGLASGLDTDTVVKQMLATRQTKIDKVKGEKQILEWKQQLYKDIAKDIKNFQFKYFSSTSENSALKTNFFLSTKATISNDKGLLGVTTTKDAIQGRYQVKINKMAKGASVSGKLTDDNIKDTKDTLSIKTADMKEATEINMSEVNTVKELINKINTHSDLKGKVKASYSEITGELKIETISTGGNQTLEIKGSLLKNGLTGESIMVANPSEYTYNLTHTIISSEVIHDLNGEKITNGDAKLSELGIKIPTGITIDGKDIRIEGKDGKEPTIESFIEEINNQSKDIGVLARFIDGKITFEKIESGSSNETGNGFSVSFSGDSGDPDPLTILGIKDDSRLSKSITSEKIVTKYKVSDIVSVDNKIEINGIELKLEQIGDTNKYTLKDPNGNVIEAVKESDGKYTLTSSKVFNVKGSSDINKDTITVRGQDAEIKIKTQDDTKDWDNISYFYKDSNKFTLDGIVFDIKAADLNETITFNVESNTDKAVENIKNFVNDYNKLIDNIAAKIYEKKQYTYKPLTDEEKEEMKEEDIKKWEEKAKQGILRGDGDLENMLYNMRNSFFDKIEGSNISLFDIGITTSSDYTQRGKLVFDSEGEVKFRKALEENSDEVYNLFTSKSSDGKSDGIFRKLDSIVNEANKVISEKAGVERYAKADEIKDTIFKTDLMREKDKIINDLISKMNDEEDRLYKQFANLETMMNYYNSQSSWLTQQLGGV